MKPLDPTGLKRLHRDWRHRTVGRVALILDGVQGPFNVGSILRTAAAYRVDHVWLAGATAPPHGANVRKTALGTDRYLTFTTVEKAVEGVAQARDRGFSVVALELSDGARPLHELELGTDVCLIVGNEDHGISIAALRASDHVAYLPQLGKVGSLNVAVAASIALYEARRQEWTRDE